MIVSLTKIIDTVQWIITVFMISSFLLFDASAWGKYSFLVCAVLIILLTVVKNRGKIRLRIEPYIVFLAVFTAYIAITAIWAIEPLESLTKARTLFRITVCFSLVYWAYMEETDPLRLIYAFVAASYVVAIYSVIFFGFENIASTSNDIFYNETYTNDAFANYNSIALFLAFGIICDVYLLLYHKVRIYSIISVLSVAVIASMRTRKAVVFLAIGVLLLILFRFSNGRSIGVRILKYISILFLSVIGIYLISKLPIFAAVNERLSTMINTFFGTGQMDASSILRMRMINLGLFCFSKKPFTGIGMGNTHIIASLYLDFNSYLHNNYIELLAGGGIFAFGIFYSMYAYLIYGYFKIRKSDNRWFVFGIVMIGLLLITDYGRVSYYTKYILFELMMLFITLRTVTNGKKELADAVETD